MTISRKLIASLKALCTILGCIVFLFSIILPFYYRLPITHGGPVWTYYWSFKAVASGWPGAIMNIKQPLIWPFWFFNYWFSENVFSQWVSLIPLAMFIVQALVLTLGIASIHFKRRVMLAAPVCLSVAVIALMLYTSEILSIGEGDYQLGYYLVFPSLALFLSAFILNEVTKNNKPKIPYRLRKSKLGEL